MAQNGLQKAALNTPVLQPFGIKQLPVQLVKECCLTKKAAQEQL